MECEKNLENLLQKINNFINIDKDKEEYCKHFTKLRDEFYNGLKKINEIFDSFANGHIMAGSYIDNLKVTKPNEYDLVLHIKLPASKHLIITKDEMHPGNVLINLRKVFEVIKNQKNHQDSYRELQKWVDTDDYLLISKFQSWVESCFHKLVLNLNYTAVDCDLKYRKMGPAHTIFVTGQFEYSVDFVPSILLPETLSVLPEKFHHSWEAIPKPIKDKTFLNHDQSFRASYHLQEGELIQNKNSLKNALRIMKKYRDCRTNLYNLKSYYIKTLFMLKNEKEDKTFWNQSLAVITVVMFKELEMCLEKEELPFLWDKRLNLLDQLTKKQISEIHLCVKSSNKLLLEANAKMDSRLCLKVYSLFLTPNERELATTRNSFVIIDEKNIKEIPECKSVKAEEDSSCAIS